MKHRKVTLIGKRLMGVRMSDHALKHSRTQLAKCGFDVTTATDGSPDILKSDVIVLIGAVASLRRTVKVLEEARGKRPRVVAWLFEPLPPPDFSLRKLQLGSKLSALHTRRHWTKPFMQLLSYPLDLILNRTSHIPVSTRHLRVLIDNFAFFDRGVKKGWLDVLAVSTEQKRLYLAEMGMKAEFLPVGQQTGFGRNLHNRRDIDLLFIGSVKSRRRRTVLDNLMAEARSVGLTTQVHPGPIWGDERTELVNRAKVLLHLHQMPWDTPWMRWYLASANGAAMASEPLLHPAPFEPGRDFLSAPIGKLIDQVAALVADEARRSKMVENCHATIARHLTHTGSIARLAAIIRELPSSGRYPR